MWTTELKLGVKTASTPPTPSGPRGRWGRGSPGPNRGPSPIARPRTLEPESPVTSRCAVLGGPGSPPEPIGELAAYASATPPTPPADAPANHLAMATKLADDEWLGAICAEGYSTVIDGRMSFKLPVAVVSRMLLRSLAHIGFERDRPHTWDARTHAEYRSISSLSQIRFLTCYGLYRSQGSQLRRSIRHLWNTFSLRKVLRSLS